MAAQTIRTTYAFDPETVARLEQLAARWKMSKSATLRRLIAQEEQPKMDARRTAWQRLRGSLSAAAADQWLSEIAAERQAADPGRKIRRTVR